MEKHGLILFCTITLSSLIVTRGMGNWKKSSLVISTSSSNKGSKDHEIILADSNSIEFRSKEWMTIFSDDRDDKDDKDDSVELEVINDVNETILLCWVDSVGKLYHYYPISDGSINDGSVSNHHVEFTNAHDAFVFIRPPKPEVKLILPEMLSSPIQYKVSTPTTNNKRPTPLTSRLPQSPIIKSPLNSLRREPLKKRKISTIDRKAESESTSLIEDDDLPQYLSEVSEESFICLYKPYLCNHRHCLTLSKDNDMNIKAKILYKVIEQEETINNFDKIYEQRKIAGFQIFAEPNVFSEYKELHNILEQELKMVRALLPSTAEKKIREDTPIYINKSIVYGSAKNPTIGKGSTYHPQNGKNWLIAHGLSDKKAGAIEMFSVEDHLKCRHLWGSGGLFLHEFCHAYHDKHVAGGFDCEIIRKAYHLAMKKGYYYY